jgi:hypothetical protein
MPARRPSLVALTVLIALTAVPAFAEFRLERRLALEPNGTFTLDTQGGSVVLTGDSPSGALVTITSRRDDLDRYFDFQFDERPGAVSVTVRRRGVTRFFFGGWGGATPQFVVHVPRATTIDINTSGGPITASGLARNARVRTSGGPLEISDVEGNVDGHTSGGPIALTKVRGNVIAHTSGGGIDVSDVRGDARVDTSGGSIEIDAVTGDLYAATSGGGVSIRRAGGRVEAHSSGGPVSVGFAPGNNRGGELSTSGGGVRAEIDPAVKLTIDASTSGGGITSDLPVAVSGRLSRQALRGDMNGGGAVLHLRSSGGGIRIASAEGARPR